MVNILFTALPTMVLIIGAYILIYKDILKKIAGVSSSKGIIMIGLAYFALAILGFFLILNNLTILVAIWIGFIVLFTGGLVYLFRTISKDDK